MARGEIDTIQLATGPYDVTRKNALEIAERIRFRHYKPEELELGKDFIRRAILPGKYYFDVYIVTKEAEKVMEARGDRALASAVPYMYRIDAICIRPPRTWIIEIKHRLLPSGLGELMTYKPIYIRQYRPVKGVWLGYVARTDNESMHEPLRDNGVRWWIVPKG